MGPYRILDVLGEGGMGLVYRAEQTEPIRRVVALKVLSVADASRDILSRFATERQALAVMDHPAIAKVFDAGSTEDGVPYFVMELVEGATLVDYCDERHLGVRDRVELFSHVCRAVQHAHQKGVIHRDLKPSNVLVSEVDGKALPRIIDFGIAKALEPEGFDGTHLTRDDEVIGTPAYMSPEQVLGSADIDTRSDVYSLGVLLYQLLVGFLPYDLAAYRGWAALAAHLTRDPPTLSYRFAELSETQETVAELRGTTAPLLRKQLSGDLDWIVARAMEKDRDERYETANGLALDLERFLADEPVRARGATTAYLLRKFVRRNRVGVGFAATVAVGIVGFAGAMAVQADRIARARDEAVARRGQAEGLIDFMLGDLREKLEPIGRLEILDGVGEQALQYFSSLPEEQFSDDELQSRSQALYQIGSVRLDQGSTAEAGVAFEESLRLAKALADRDPLNTERLFGLSQSHFYVGYAAWLAGNFEVAEGEFQRYLAVAEELVALEPDNLEYRLELGYAHSNLGSVREARGDLGGAVESFSKTMDVKQDLVSRDSTNVAWMGELAEEHNKLAVVYRKMGRYEDARAEHSVELSIKERALRIDPTHAYWIRRLAWAHHFLGRTELALGDLESAADRFDEALATLAPVVDRDPSNNTVLRNRATFQTHRAGALSLLGRHGEARGSAQAAISELEAQVKRDSTRLSLRGTLGWARTEHSLILLRAGQPQAALAEAEVARSFLETGEVGDRETRPRLAFNRLALGYALEALDRTDEAVALRGEALALLEAAVAETGGEEYRALLAEALLVLDRLPEAAQEIEILSSQGFREPRLWALSREKGIEP